VAISRLWILAVTQANIIRIVEFWAQTLLRLGIQKLVIFPLHLDSVYALPGKIQIRLLPIAACFFQSCCVSLLMLILHYKYQNLVINGVSTGMCEVGRNLGAMKLSFFAAAVGLCSNDVLSS